MTRRKATAMPTRALRELPAFQPGLALTPDKSSLTQALRCQLVGRCPATLAIHVEKRLQLPGFRAERVRDSSRAQVGQPGSDRSNPRICARDLRKPLRASVCSKARGVRVIASRSSASTRSRTGPADRGCASSARATHGDDGAVACQSLQRPAPRRLVRARERARPRDLPPQVVLGGADGKRCFPRRKLRPTPLRICFPGRKC
jgi:hypothetical protein